MRTIKVNCTGFPGGTNFEDLLFIKILKERYNLVISEEPEYVFCGPYNGYSYCKYNGIRIFYPFEFLYPDLNVVDYSFGIPHLCCEDRYCTFFTPIFTNYIFSLNSREKLSKKDILEKSKFCNFIYSHEGCKQRTRIFEVLNSYKKVESIGRYLNNVGYTLGDIKSINGGIENNEKIEYQKDFKFSIACENQTVPYYFTEKITDAFASRTIPIYFGDPKITEVFNKKSFINANDYSSFEEMLEDIKKIDSDDNLFLEMINQPVFNETDYLIKEYKKFEKFILNIFEQPYDKAFRRPDTIWALKHELQLLLGDIGSNEKEETLRLNKYFKNKNINKISIFGNGSLYKKYQNILYKSEVEIKNVIVSKYAENINKEEICLIDDVEAYCDADMIIVTAIDSFEEIKKQIEERCNNIEIISLKDLIYIY